MSARFAGIKPKDIIQALQRADFYIHHQTGSHVRLFHKIHLDLRVTVPVHPGDLPFKIIKSIIRQAELTNQEFFKLLE